MIIRVKHSTDKEGREIVSVPVAKSPKPAVLYAGDFDYLMNLGVSPKWTYRTGNVCSDSFLKVARAIVDVGAGQYVLYADKDTLNLRRDNLIIAYGGNTKHRAIALIKPRLDKIEVKHIYSKSERNDNNGAETAMSD